MQHETSKHFSNRTSWPEGKSLWKNLHRSVVFISLPSQHAGLYLKFYSNFMADIRKKQQDFLPKASQ